MSTNVHENACPTEIPDACSRRGAFRPHTTVLAPEPAAGLLDLWKVNSFYPQICQQCLGVQGDNNSFRVS